MTKKARARWMLRGLWMLVWVLPGCDAMVHYQFHVINSTEQQLRIACQAGKLDTTFLVSPGNRSQILAQHQLNSGVRPYFTADTIWWFDRLQIMRADNVPYQGEARLVTRWNFLPGEKGVGIYALTVNDEDFE